MSELADEVQTFQRKVHVPAAVGAVIDADNLLDCAVAGSRMRTTPDDLARVDDQWHIGSCGKAMTAALWARLVEAGVAEWDIPVGDLFADINPIDPGWCRPTIDDLLRCRAGVSANPSPSEMKQSHRSIELVVDQRTAAATMVLRSPPKQPGRFVYSNLGYAVIGAAIDRLAGEPYEAAMATHVWQPLKIDSAATGAPPLVRGHHPRIRVGMALVGRGRPAEADDRWGADNPPLLTPAGRWHLTMADWARFVQVFLDGHPDFLSNESINRLLTHPDGNTKNLAMGWASGQRLGADFAMQGSNTMWAATALLDRQASLAALSVANDGRMRVLLNQAQLAKRLLDHARSRRPWQLS